MFDVAEGDLVVLKLPTNPTTGHDWVVTATTQAFGHPSTSWEADSVATGTGGTRTFTWQTTGWFSLVGTHSVTLEYRRPWQTTGPADKTFTFTVNVVAP